MAFSWFVTLMGRLAGLTPVAREKRGIAAAPTAPAGLVRGAHDVDGLLRLNRQALGSLLDRKLRRLESVLSVDITGVVTGPEVMAIVDQVVSPTTGHYLLSEEDIDALAERVCDVALERAILVAARLRAGTAGCS